MFKNKKNLNEIKELQKQIAFLEKAKNINEAKEKIENKLSYVNIEAYERKFSQPLDNINRLIKKVENIILNLNKNIEACESTINSHQNGVRKAREKDRIFDQLRG